jgi:hypothetical protein
MGFENTFLISYNLGSTTIYTTPSHDHNVPIVQSGNYEIPVLIC